MNTVQKQAIETKIASIQTLTNAVQKANVIYFYDFQNTNVDVITQNPDILAKCKDIALAHYAQELEELRKGLDDEFAEVKF